MTSKGYIIHICIHLYKICQSAHMLRSFGSFYIPMEPEHEASKIRCWNMHFPAKIVLKQALGVGTCIHLRTWYWYIYLYVPQARVNSNPRFSSCEPSKSTIQSTTMLTPRATSQRRFGQKVCNLLIYW